MVQHGLGQGCLFRMIEIDSLVGPAGSSNAIRGGEEICSSALVCLVAPCDYLPRPNVRSPSILDRSLEPEVLQALEPEVLRV